MIFVKGSSGGAARELNGLAFISREAAGSGFFRVLSER
jgi:hypothetical protein